MKYQIIPFYLFFYFSGYSVFAQDTSDFGDYKKYQSLTYTVLDSCIKKSPKKEKLPYAKAAREKAKEEFGELDSVFVAYNRQIAYAYSGLGKYAKALPFFVQNLAIREKMVGSEHPNYAITLNRIGLLHKRMGDYPTALEYYQQAIDIYENDSSQKKNLASVLNNFALLSQKMGDYETALPIYKKVIRIREELLGPENPSLAVSINNFASFYRRMGDYNRALPLYKRAIAIQKKAEGTESANYLNMISNLAIAYRKLGDYDKALPLYIEAMRMRERVLGREHPSYATSLNNLSLAYNDLGKYAEALTLQEQAVKIQEKVLGKEHPTYAKLLSNVGNLYQQMGNYPEALSFFFEAKNIRERTLGKEHPSYAQSLVNLAVLYQKTKNNNKALVLYQEAIRIIEKVLGKEHPNYGYAVNSLAYLYKEMKDYPQALVHCKKGLTVQEKVFGKTHATYIRMLNSLAQLYEEMNDIPMAWETVNETMSLATATTVSLRFDQSWADTVLSIAYPSRLHLKYMVGALNLIYILLERDSRIDNPIPKQRVVTDVGLALLSKISATTFSDEDKLEALEQSSYFLQKSLAILSPEENARKAFNLSDQNKSVLLSYATKSEKAYRLGGLPDSLAFQNKQLLNKQSKLQAKIAEKRPEEEKSKLRGELIATNQELDELRKIIQNKYPKYYQLKYEATHTDIETIQALLDEKTAIIEYVIADTILHIFKIDQTSIKWVKHPLDKEELQKNINDFHLTLSDYLYINTEEKKAYRQYTQLAHWFYLNTLAPVIEGETKIKNLIVVTDGELGHIPFETFITQQASQRQTNYKELDYLVKDYTVSYNYSTHLWKENQEAAAPQNNRQILAMAANYEIPLDSNTIEYRLPTDWWIRTALTPLPAARNEVETLQEKYKGLFLFDELASERTAKEKAADFAILHFATHGILDPKNTMLSSLAFTEDGDSVESNFWQAHEISKMKLNANLVVLSACKTGFGEFEKGNGIASLARSFMYAGAPSLMVSLWQVNDMVTSIIMNKLYANLADGMNKDEALRQAKLQYLAAAQGIAGHPAFWSPFIQIGNTTPVPIQRKGMATVWWVVLGGIALLGMGMAWQRSKGKVG